jgi:hypothetical protein
VADPTAGDAAELSEWLELMLAEIAQRQDESRAAAAEQAARGSPASPPAASPPTRSDPPAPVSRKARA